MGDREVVAAQLGRPLRSEADVVVRCHLEVPVVTRVPPRLDDGTPFPTRYWLSCPLAVVRIDRIEAAGGVASMDQRRLSDPAFGGRLVAAHERYRNERDAALVLDAGPRPSGGIAGSNRGVKCLHAHYADHAAGNDNPVGEWVADQIEPLDCTTPCIVATPEGVLRNPEWSEPT
jgi:hypothetical protein